jgi:TnpA family transposase
MLQVVLSIKSGKLSSSILLRKLGSYSKRNKLCLALRELGYVVRTLFLLDYISDVELREEITAQTNKVESYNGFTEWLSFGNPYTIVASNDPEEHEKSIKYNDIIANAVMFQNVVDMSHIVLQLHAEGYTVTKQDLARQSPQLTEHLNRFGEYVVNMNIEPTNIQGVMQLPI